MWVAVGVKTKQECRTAIHRAHSMEESKHCDGNRLQLRLGGEIRLRRHLHRGSCARDDVVAEPAPCRNYRSDHLQEDEMHIQDVGACAHAVTLRVGAGSACTRGKEGTARERVRRPAEKTRK